MKHYLSLLEKQLNRYQANCGKEDTVPILDILWYCYFQENPIDDGQIRDAELALRPAFEALSLENSDALFDRLDGLISHYQRAAFLDGIHTGIRLARELA